MCGAWRFGLLFMLGDKLPHPPPAMSCGCMDAPPRSTPNTLTKAVQNKTKNGGKGTLNPYQRPFQRYVFLLSKCHASSGD